MATDPTMRGLGSTSDKNNHLKGRRRFNADLADIEAKCSTGNIVEQGFRIQSLKAGEDEGTIEVTICTATDNVRLNLLISDTSDYPKSHIFFCSSSEQDMEPHVSHIIESVASDSPRTIQETLQKLLGFLGKAFSRTHQGSELQEVDTDEDENTSIGEYEALDAFDDIAGIEQGKLDSQCLQNDFIETVATGYRPGFLRFSNDDFAISVSVHVVELAKFIPPRAMMAWDRRLLSRSQYLTLLISGFRGVYAPLDHGGAYSAQAQRTGSTLTFKVGLTTKYKPGKDYAKDAGRTFGLILTDAEDEVRIQAEKAVALEDVGSEYTDPSYAFPVAARAEEHQDDGIFDRFSLSSSLESLLDQSLLKLIQLRRKFGLGWAGAELLFSIMEKTQTTEDHVFNAQQQDLLAADAEETQLARTNKLPHDPLLSLPKENRINVILTAFCYLIRRLTLCPRYCIVCHNKLNNDFEALKPYYEIIHNPKTVDLLVSLAHSAATEQVLNDPLPIGLGLRVPLPDANRIPGSPRSSAFTGSGVPFTPTSTSQGSSLTSVSIGPDGMCDFDALSLPMMRAAIAVLIDTLPAVDDMKKHLERKVKAGKAKPRLKDLDPTVLPAAWSILRWCVASCTAHLEEITSPGDESIKNLGEWGELHFSIAASHLPTIDPGWRQFRFSVGSPDAEAKFTRAVIEAQGRNNNAISYPSLYIIRHGLWFKDVVNGRAYGHGVYLAKEGNISMGTYAQPGRSTWHRSRICPTNCVALAEVVNLPSEFVSHNPYFVIKDTHWIICRYLLVKGAIESSYDTFAALDGKKNESYPFVKLDPSHPVTLNSQRIEIPEPTYQIAALLSARREEFHEEDNDAEDIAVFENRLAFVQVIENAQRDDDMMDVDIDTHGGQVANKDLTEKSAFNGVVRKSDDWKHDPKWVSGALTNLMSPPSEASPSATMAVQRELKAMLKEQHNAKSLKELGWFIPPDVIDNNLFQWIVEMHSFEETLPIARDMKARNLNSVIFEIRFPSTFPLSPPFFRIITPRFLPFIQGGGGHVTAGGSICMDLLTSDGWLPSYSISAVLLQIKLALSNLEPRPARLAPDFHRLYDTHEALTGFKRAAATHGWQVPTGTDKLLR
ncbi:hypothetical protein H0H92_007210 [Tricholoma furcatifolium]|nr:hypothetical protein H0H92_007210 [Tricholoma furcatifolium]